MIFIAILLTKCRKLCGSTSLYVHIHVCFKYTVAMVKQSVLHVKTVGKKTNVFLAGFLYYILTYYIIQFTVLSTKN